MSSHENGSAAATDSDVEYFSQFTNGIRLEQESYLLQHPEIRRILIAFFAKMLRQQTHPMEVLKNAALYFTRTDTVLEKEIRELLKLSDNEFKASLQSDTKYKSNKYFKSENLLKFMNIDTSKEQTKAFSVVTSTSNTKTSSFMSILTSETTLVASEQIQPIEQTSSEIYRKVILKIINKAVYSQVTEEDILYDIAYVELMKVVEIAMEIPVLQIRQDLADLMKMVYYMFELHLDESKRIAAQKTREIAMEKKLKKTLRRHHNYKGYETQHMAESKTSLHESFKESCKDLSQFHYNRYPKDRFGVYLPRNTKFGDESVTAAVTVDEVIKQNEQNIDLELISLKSVDTTNSGIILSAFKSNSARKMNFVVKGHTFQRDKSDEVSKLTSAHIILFKPTLKRFKKITK